MTSQISPSPLNWNEQWILGPHHKARHCDTRSEVSKKTAARMTGNSSNRCAPINFRPLVRSRLGNDGTPIYASTTPCPNMSEGEIQLCQRDISLEHDLWNMTRQATKCPTGEFRGNEYSTQPIDTPYSSCTVSTWKQQHTTENVPVQIQNQWVPTLVPKQLTQNNNSGCHTRENRWNNTTRQKSIEHRALCNPRDQSHSNKL